MKSILVILSLLFSASAFAGISVIVHPSNSTSLTEDEVARIFLGKMKSFPGGGSAVPINAADGSNQRDTFNDVVLQKSSSQIKAYWSKLIFTGKGTPPQEADSDSEILNLIKSNPNLIGYVSNEAVTGDVKVVAQF